MNYFMIKICFDTATWQTHGFFVQHFLPNLATSYFIT